MNTAEKIIALRAERGISQQELADAVFVSRSLVSMWEAGTRIPDSLSVEKMAALFNVSEEEILSDRKYAFASSLERKLIGDEIAEFTDVDSCVTDDLGRIATTEDIVDGSNLIDGM